MKFFRKIALISVAVASVGTGLSATAAHAQGADTWTSCNTNMSNRWLPSATNGVVRSSVSMNGHTALKYQFVGDSHAIIMECATGGYGRVRLVSTGSNRVLRANRFAATAESGVANLAVQRIYGGFVLVTTERVTLGRNSATAIRYAVYDNSGNLKYETSRKVLFLTGLSSIAVDNHHATPLLAPDGRVSGWRMPVTVGYGGLYYVGNVNLW